MASSSTSQIIKSYDEIVEHLNNNPARKMESRKLCSVLCSLPKEHREYLYMYIVHHDQLHGTKTKTWRSNPYKGKTYDGGKGVMYNWMNLPPKLQDIFTEYIRRISTD